MSMYEEKSFVEDANRDSSYTNYGFTSNLQPDMYNTRTSGYSRSDEIIFSTADIAQNQNQRDTYYSDYGNCYTPAVDGNIRHAEIVRHTENFGTKSGDIQGEYNELINQSTTKSGPGVNEAKDITQPNSHRHDMEQLHARREQNRALKQSKASDPITEQLARVEPIEVTFFDRKKGIEYDAYGQVIVPPVLDANALASTEFNEDVIQPYADPPPYDKRYQDPGQPDPAGDYSQPASDHLQPFQEWYRGYNPTVQQGEQPTLSWQTQQKAPKVPNYLILSIVACFFCIPLGGIALGYVINSSNQRKEGKYQAAIDSASTALKLCIVAIVLGVIAAGVTGFMIWYQAQRINKILSPST